MLGNEIHGFVITWRASCASHQHVGGGTAQGNTRIVVHDGTWSSLGSYRAAIRPKGYSARFRLLVNRGRFLTASTAHGVFRLRVRIFHGTRAVDRCDTGRITWSARRTG